MCCNHHCRKSGSPTEAWVLDCNQTLSMGGSGLVGFLLELWKMLLLHFFDSWVSFYVMLHQSKWAKVWVITEQIVSNRGDSHVATNRDAPSVNSSTLCTVHSYLKHFQIDSREPTIYWSFRSWQSTKATQAGITFEVKVLNDNQTAQQCLRHYAIKWLCLVLGLQCPVCLRKIFSA